MCDILIKCLLLFFICVLMQIIIWRLLNESIRHGLNFFKALPWLLGIFFVAGPVIGFWLSGIHIGCTNMYSVGITFLAIMFFHVLASLIYISIYTVMADFSPSMEILKLVERNQPAGILREEVGLPFGNASLFDERYQNMLSTNMIEKKGERFVLLGRGKMIAYVFLFYRRFLGIEHERNG